MKNETQNSDEAGNLHKPLVSGSWIEQIDDGLNCIAMHIYGKPYAETHWAERENIHAKNEWKSWIEDNRAELLKYSRLL